MPTVKALLLTAETRAALAAQARGEWRDTALDHPVPEGSPPGTAYVPVSDDVADAVERRRLPGETDDDVVRRMIALAGPGLV